ncbi:MAG TPA: heme exporter protein CcmD [Pyrinomonadaceae bacterium]|nr:heme exporter protein CcmD [Pyrinomonadaceae bacterium]
MDWSDFFSMGGYAFYVWGSYLVTLVAIGAEVIALVRRKKNLSRQLSRRVSSTGSDYR